MNIDLSKPLELPNKFVRQLMMIENQCIDIECSELLFERNEVKLLIRALDSYCRSNRVIGVHYTRALSESIKSKGLLIRDGDEIRNQFLIEYRYLFSKKEILTIKKRWNDYFTKDQICLRNNRIFFNFTEAELGSSATKYLLGLYGGEQISMCFELDEPIGLKLSKIGSPLIIRCSLDPNQVETYTENPWGKILISSFHKLINPNICRFDQDGDQSVPVTPENIIEIRTL